MEVWKKAAMERVQNFSEFVQMDQNRKTKPKVELEEGEEEVFFLERKHTGKKRALNLEFVEDFYGGFVWPRINYFHELERLDGDDYFQYVSFLDDEDHLKQKVQCIHSTIFLSISIHTRPSHTNTLNTCCLSF